MTATATIHRIALTTAAAAIALAGVAVMPGQASAATLSAPAHHVERTCTGSGENHKCLYCIYADGIKDCFWVKVPEKTSGSRPAGDLTSASTSSFDGTFSTR